MNKKLKKQIYKKLCLFSERTIEDYELLKTCPSDYFESQDKKLKECLTKKEFIEFQHFINSGGNFGLVKSNCCYCNVKLNEDKFYIITSYWNPLWKPCCSEKCSLKCYKKEEYECQLIDSNCNECIHFERKDFSSNSKSQTHNLFQPVGCYIGDCKKLKKIAGANRNNFQGMDCFEHRNKPKDL